MSMLPLKVSFTLLLAAIVSENDECDLWQKHMIRLNSSDQLILFGHQIRIIDDNEYINDAVLDFDVKKIETSHDSQGYLWCHDCQHIFTPIFIGMIYF